MVKEFSFEELALSGTDLIPNATYHGKRPIRHGNRPLDALFKGIVDENGNNEQKGLETSGGIRTRYIGNKGSDRPLGFMVIRNDLTKSIYPNKYDETTNILTYYGDNNKVDQDPLEKQRKGTRNLKWQFDYAYNKNNCDKKRYCPILYFESLEPNKAEQKFIGIAYPFVAGKKYEDVVKRVETNGISNYRFQFTVVPEIVTKQWLYELLLGNKGNTSSAPLSWNKYHERLALLETTSKISLEEDIQEEFTNYFLGDPFKDESITTSYKLTKAKSRIGQLKIRNKLLKTRKSCELCGISNSNILVASHILPWSTYADDRGNLYNVMLLCANHDKLIDRKLISFNPQNGKILISKQIDKVEYKMLGLTDQLRIEMNEQRKKIFEEHNHLFQT